MNQAQVALRPKNGHVTISGNDPLDIYPDWYKYLLGSYPNSQTSSIQTKAMLHQFKDCDPALLFDAAAEFVRTDSRRTRDGQRVFSMPIPTEFWDVVERIKSRREDVARMAEQERIMNRATLRVRRDELLQAWYVGEASDGDLLALAGEMEQVGLEYAAASLRAKARPVVERPGYTEFVAGYVERLRVATANNQG